MEANQTFIKFRFVGFISLFIYLSYLLFDFCRMSRTLYLRDHENGSEYHEHVFSMYKKTPNKLELNPERNVFILLMLKPRVSNYYVF